jgi:hypothetical protein
LSTDEGTGGSLGGSERAQDSNEVDTEYDTISGGYAAWRTREEITVGDTRAIIWGEGDRGVVLAHGAAYDAASWEPQAQEMAHNGMMVLAVEDTSPENLIAAVEHLNEARGVERTALIGASAGAGAVLKAAEGNPVGMSQVILISGVGDVSRLGEYPKLFVVSEGDSIANRERQMAEQAPGQDNELLILPGNVHSQAIFETDQGDKLMQAILEQLRNYR